MPVLPCLLNQSWFGWLGICNSAYGQLNLPNTSLCLQSEVRPITPYAMWLERDGPKQWGGQCISPTYLSRNYQLRDTATLLSQCGLTMSCNTQRKCASRTSIHPSTLPKLTVPSTWLLQAGRARSAYAAAGLFTAKTSGLMPGCRAVEVTNKPVWFLLCYALVWVYPTRLGSFIMLCKCKDFFVIYPIDHLDNERFRPCVRDSVL